MLREILRCLAWVTCSVLLVLLVPSSAWSGETGSPQPSPSSSPSDGSSSPATPEPTPTETPEPTPTTDPPAEPTPSEGESTPPPTTDPTSDPTADPVTDTEPTTLSCTPDTPCVVEPSQNTVALALLLGGVCTLALVGMFVRSFAG